MLQCPRLSSTRTWFVLSTPANAVAPLTPIGLLFMYSICIVSFVHSAFANWDAPSESMLQCPRPRQMRVWFVLNTEASEVLLWREKFEFFMSNFLSVVLRWNPLMISSTDWEAREMPSSLRLMDDASSSLKALQSSAPTMQLNDRCSSELSAVSDANSGTVPLPMRLWDRLRLFRWGMCGMRWERVALDSESNLLSSRLSVSIFLINCFGNFNRCFTPSDVRAFLLKFSSEILPMQWVSSSSAPRNKSSILSASMWWCLKSIFQVQLLWETQ